MDPQPLVRSVLAAMILLERSESDEIDPDVAADGLEAVCGPLLSISREDRLEFLDCLSRIAQDEKDPAVADFIRSVPFVLGFDFR